MKNSIFLFVFVLFALNSCTPKDNFSKLKDFASKNNFEIENFKDVMVISEKGCVTCNKSFALLVQKKLNSKNTLFIVSAKGNTVDISSYLESENTILDFEDKFSSLNIVEHSSAIFLENSKIDTIVKIEAKNLENSLMYISKSN